MIEEVQFESDGARVSGLLYAPDKESRAPAILLCHGFAGVKELLLPAFAERFCGEGYVVLTFDYRGFGQSEGEPGRIVPRLQVQDIDAAVTYLCARSEVDPERIALWGTSFGGANVIVAAGVDLRVRCVLVQLAFGDGERVITGHLNDEEKKGLFAILERMKARKIKTGKEKMVAISKVLADPQSQRFYERYVDRFPELRTKIPFLTIAETIGHKPIDVVHKVKVPILLVAASDDTVNPKEESERLFAAANEPKELCIIDGATHYDVYESPHFETAFAKQVEWLKRYL